MANPIPGFVVRAKDWVSICMDARESSHSILEAIFLQSLSSHHHGSCLGAYYISYHHHHHHHHCRRWTRGGIGFAENGLKYGGDWVTDEESLRARTGDTQGHGRDEGEAE